MGRKCYGGLQHGCIFYLGALLYEAAYYYAAYLINCLYSLSYKTGIADAISDFKC